jgi:hypothetical protein
MVIFYLNLNLWNVKNFFYEIKLNIYNIEIIIFIYTFLKYYKLKIAQKFNLEICHYIFI